MIVYQREVLGKNEAHTEPAAMGRTRLSNRTGAAYDPCIALQVGVDLDPAREAEIVFIFGEGANSDEARSIVRRFQDPEEVGRAYRETISWWDRVLGVVQVDTPDMAAYLFS